MPPALGVPTGGAGAGLDEPEGRATTGPSNARNRSWRCRAR